MYFKYSQIIVLPTLPTIVSLKSIWQTAIFCFVKSIRDYSLFIPLPALLIITVLEILRIVIPCLLRSECCCSRDSLNRLISCESRYCSTETISCKASLSFCLHYCTEYCIRPPKCSDSHCKLITYCWVCA